MSTKNPARILVIEDNETNRELMVYLLAAFGYSILEASNGEEGVAIARREQPDLIVCDVHLPKLDGYGVVAELRTDNVLRKTPIIAVTALAMLGDRDRLLSSGFDGYVSKPIVPETFVQEVEQFLSADQRTNVVRNIQAAPSEMYPKKVISNVGAGVTILVVDDLPENIEFARSTLEPSGYRVLAAAGVQEAVAVAENERPDLVLCDLHMHPQGGYALLDHAKVDRALREIPIVIISSTSSDAYDQMDCLKRGAADFIRRPIDPEALLAEIGKTLRK
jgi:two-component system cell cycle response regulator